VPHDFNGKKIRAADNIVATLENTHQQREDYNISHWFLEDLVERKNFFWLTEKGVGGWTFAVDSLRLY